MVGLGIYLGTERGRRFHPNEERLTMRIALVVCVLCSLVGGGAVNAAEPDRHDGPKGYLSLYGGVAIPESFDNGRQGAASISSIKLSPGPLVGIKIGMMGSDKDSVARWLGIELDGSYMQPKIENQTVQASAGTLRLNIGLPESTVKLITGAVHVLVRFSNGPLQPYIGAGPAVVHARVSDSSGLGGGTSTTIGLSAVGGFRVMLSDGIGAFLEYKHIRSELEFETTRGDAVIHAGVGGFSFLF